MFNQYNRLTLICLTGLLMSAAYSLPAAFAPRPSRPDIRQRTTVCNGFELPHDIRQKNFFLARYRHMISRPDLLPLLDKTNNIAPDYLPQDLVPLNGQRQLRAEAAEQFQNMAAAAKNEGIILTPQSAYRSYDYQNNLYRRSKKLRGREYTDKYIAAPGHSQHQLGLAVDINSTQVNFENTPAYAWLARHAGDYGYSLSFPDGQEAKTGFYYEPWHYRYVTPAGAAMQRDFFGGSQHDMLNFFDACIKTPAPAADI